MSGIIPQRLISVLKTFNDFGVQIYGIDCTLYVPTNLTDLEPDDIYTSPSDVTYQTFRNVKVWIEWFVKDLHRLRKLGVFAENEVPIVAKFKNTPEVTINSYIKLESQYIPGFFDTDEFEVVDVLMRNMYDNEIYRYYKLAPLRKKNT